MELLVDHVDQQGAHHARRLQMSRLAFAKHMAFAGQRYAPIPANLFRSLGMFLHYAPYLRREAFNASHFSRPGLLLRDPTEQTHFSNIAGKAIADYLSKKLDGAIATQHYEAAMRKRKMSLAVGRPDLLAFTRNGQFAIEAKGRHQANPGNMAKHKKQSRTGGIKVNFTVACVSYHLYDRIRCNYHDPYDGNVPFDRDLLQALTRDYYAGLAQYLDNDTFRYTETEYQGERFFEVDLSRPMRYLLERDMLFPFPPHWFEFLRPSLILPGDIKRYGTEGLTGELGPFIQEAVSDDSSVYIDNDRVGLRIQQW